FRWTPELDHDRELPDLYRGIRLQQHGISLRHGVRAVRLHRRSDTDRAAGWKGAMSTATVKKPRNRFVGTRARRSRTTNFVLLLAVTLLVLFPFIWMIGLAFTPAELAFRDVKIWPDQPTWENFVTALTVGNLGRAFLN